MQSGYLTKESGSWLGHFTKWILDDETGRRKRVQKAWKIGAVADMTKTEANEKLRERVVEEVGITADGGVTVEWFTEHRWKPLKEGGWRDSTAQTNKELLQVIFDRFGSTAVQKVDQVELQSWLNSLAKKRSGSAIKHIRFFLKSIFAAAHDQQYIRRDPARMLTLPKLKAVQRPYLSIEEVQRLLKAARSWTCSPRDSALIQFELCTALRPSELFALKWGCIDFAKGILTIRETIYRGEVRPFTKTTEENETQQLVIPKLAMDALSTWHYLTTRKQDDDYVFPNSEGGFISKENYQSRVLKELAEQAGLAKLNFQILRRTTATHAQSEGSLKSVSAMLRHKQETITQQVYIQAIAEDVRATAEGLAQKLLTRPA